MAECRSCGAEILWAQTERGSSIPLDPVPDPRGNLVIEVDGPGDGWPPAHVRRTAVYVREGERPDEPRYLAHFATCPQAESHRRAR